LPSPGGNITYSGLATDGTRFLLVGQKPRNSGGDGAAAFVSEDGGDSWQELDFADYSPFRIAVFSGGRWWIGGQEGVILRTETLAGEWDEASPPSLQDVRALSAHGPVVIAALAGGGVFRSLDGADTWENGAAGSGFWPLNLVNYEGLFVLSGGDRAAGSSTRDGLTWQLPGSGGAYGPIALATDGGPVRFVSLNGEEVWEAGGPWVPGVLQPEEPPVYWIGQAVDLRLLAAGNPTSWKVAGMPKGLSFSPSTQSLTGSTRRVGKVWISFTASNAVGPSNTTRIPFTFNTPFPIAVGSYQAVLEPNALNEGMGGRVTLQVNRVGAVSGRVELGLRSFPFRGELDTEGNGIFLLDSPPGPQLLIEVGVGMDEASAGQFAGRVLQGVAEIPYTGFRNAWNSRSNPATAWAGRFHSGLFAEENQPLAPKGTGFARLMISANGRASVSGRLANHAALTWSGFLSPGGFWEMFARQGRAGCVCGAIPIDPGLLGKPLVGTLRWTTVDTGNVAGFQTDLTVRGSLYTAPPRGEMLWNLPVSPDNVLFYRTTQSPLAVTVEANHRVSVPGGSSLQVISLQISGGTWRGRFLNTSGRETSFQGQILTVPWSLAVGYALPDGVSEAVELRPNPLNP
jgi:hypothetical protein